MSNAAAVGIAPRRSLTALWLVLLAAGLAGWAAYALPSDSHRAYRALLINFTYFAPLAAGMAVWSTIVLLSNGRWTGPLERVAMSGLAFGPLAIAALLALWQGADKWALFLTDAMPHQKAWLGGTAVFGRNLAGLTLVWLIGLWYLRRRRMGQGHVSGGLLALTYALAFSLVGFDLIASLDPHWYSTLFGGYYFISGLYTALAAWTLICILRGPVAPARLHDLGKLLVAFSIITTYLMYSQLLPIWYENLPAERRFIVPRLNFGPWPTVSVALLGTIYLGPLVFLLPRRFKESRGILGAGCVVVLAGMWVERWWLIVPTYGLGIQYGLPEAAMTAAFLGAFGLCVEQFLRRRLAGVSDEVIGE